MNANPELCNISDGLVVRNVKRNVVGSEVPQSQDVLLRAFIVFICSNPVYEWRAHVFIQNSVGMCSA